MQQVLQVKDHEEHNQKLWIDPLIPLQRHSFCLHFLSILPKVLSSHVAYYNRYARQSCTIFKTLYARHLFAAHCHVLFRLCVHDRCGVVNSHLLKYLGLPL